MKSLIASLCVLAAPALAFSADPPKEAAKETAKDTKPDAKMDEKREKLDTAIKLAIDLLEKKDHEALLQNFVMPETLKKLTENRTIKEFAKDFGGDKADRLLRILKTLDKIKPTMSDEGKKATFALEEEIGGKKEISFKKIEKFWYIDGK